MSKYDTARPFAASFVILRKDGKIAFVLRQNTKWMNNFYGLPSGKVEVGETYAQAAIHEAMEEAGVAINEENLIHVLTVHRKADDETGSWADVYFEAKNWEGDVVNAEPHMHAEIAWLDPKKLPDNVIPSVKFALEQIEAGKNYTEYNWK